MLGEKARWFKGLQYDGSAKVPLLWRGPKGAPENRGRAVDKVVGNVDILPTLLEAVNIPVPERIQGRSFLKLARGADPRWNNRCFSQLHAGMLRRDDWKLIDNSLDGSGALELYDLKNDPREERNLINEAKHRELVTALAGELKSVRGDRPGPVTIAGMPTPVYATISDRERKELRESAPSDQN